MKRPRLRKWAKWACTTAAMLCISVAVASRFWKVGYARCADGRMGYRGVGFGAGLLTVLWNGDPQPLLQLGWVVEPAYTWYWGTAPEAARLGIRVQASAGVWWWK